MSVDNSILIPERSTDPDTPASTKWRWYFKAAGLHIIDDAGTVTGPLIDASSAGTGDLSADTLVLNDGSELTIATGAITVTHARHSVDTEADAASDDLATVNGLAANEVCIITANNTARTVVVKHGMGNISCATGADISLDDDIKAVCLLGNIAGTGVNAYPLNGGTGGGSMSSFDLAADSGTPETVADGNTLTLAGGTGIDTSVAATDTVTIAIDSTVATLTGSQVLTNKTIDADDNTLSQGTSAIKTLSGGVAAAGTDRNLVIAAESGTADDLIEVTGLVVGETALLRADTGDTITVKHNDAGATVKIHLSGDADVVLDAQNPLRLTLVATNVLVEDRQGAGSGSATVVIANQIHKFSTNQTTTSNTMVDVDATNAAVTLTGLTSGSALVTFSGSFSKLSAGSGFFRITDGTNNSTEFEVEFGSLVDVITWTVAVSASPTTFKLQYRSNDANTVVVREAVALGASVIGVG